MAKQETRWVCQECNWSYVKQMGRCPHCGAWDSMEEVILTSKEESSAAHHGAPMQHRPQPLSKITSGPVDRLPIPMSEFARVLGGGLVPGSMVLIGGEPGIGKSTLLLQVAAQIGSTERPVLYVSGEESPQQIKMRAQRLDIQGDPLHLLPEVEVATILHQANQMQPQLQALVIDSIQTMRVEGNNSAPGNVSQVRDCASHFQRWAKEHGVPVFIVGHVTKQGSIAGPKVLEHIVDTVLYLEGDPFHTYRLLRSVKNRFGPTSEVGVFDMQARGMIEVENPSEAFLAERMVNVPGSTIAITMEGTRPLLVELQALASYSSFGHPRRTANGVDVNRLLLVIAVLSRRVGVRLSEQDVFANVVGGLRIEEPAADLALAVALASSVRDQPVPADLTIVGEVGLSGEVRSVSQIEARMSEAARLGFERVILPRAMQRRQLARPDGLQLLPVRSLSEAITTALGPKP
jgi:DNA repair protein RadA/Sms